MLRARCSDSCRFDNSGRGNAAAVLGNTATHKINLSASWRTRAGIDLAADLHHVSGVYWVEKSFNPSAVGGVDFISYPVDAYTLLNARVGWRVVKDKLDLGAATSIVTR